MNGEATGIRHMWDKQDAVSKMLSLTEVEKMPLGSSINRILESPVVLPGENAR